MNISTTFPKYYPSEIYFCFVNLKDDISIEILPSYPLDNEWGKVTNIQSCNVDSCSLFQGVDIVWLSLCERKFYSVEMSVNIEVSHSDEPKTFLVGMMPYGRLIMWMHGIHKSEIVGCCKGEEVLVDMENFLPDNPQMNLDDYCKRRIDCNLMVKNHLELEGLHSQAYFDNKMRQYSYRYNVLYKQWKNGKWGEHLSSSSIPKFDYIEEILYDGTHDKLHDGGLMKYHHAGKPKKLRVQWRVGKSEYSAYFWFEDERIREVFDRFYGAHSDTKTDFIIRIDAEKRKYELALYRYGLKEPQIIPEDVYQLLVFKNKFEDYRSDNYNQERGAWIW